jgi:hypothetical protein
MHLFPSNRQAETAEEENWETDQALRMRSMAVFYVVKCFALFCFKYD